MTTTTGDSTTFVDSSGVSTTMTSADSTVVEPTLEQMPPKDGGALGAIVGGVIGGLVFLLLVAALIWWLVRRRPKPSEADSSGATPLDSTLRRSHNYGAFPSSPNEYGAAPVIQYDATLPGGHYGAAPSPSQVRYDSPDSALQ